MREKDQGQSFHGVDDLLRFLVRKVFEARKFPQPFDGYSSVTSCFVSLLPLHALLDSSMKLLGVTLGYSHLGY